MADACVLVAERGRLMQALPAGGAMAAVAASEAVVAAEISAVGVEIAAVNAAGSVVVWGVGGGVYGFVGGCGGVGRRVRRLAVSHAFHSSLMEPMLDGFRAVVEGLSFAAPTIPVVSTIGGEVSTPEYWVRQVREAVRFADGVRSLHRNGVTRFLELGPDGVLAALAQQVSSEAVFGVLLRPGRG